MKEKLFSYLMVAVVSVEMILAAMLTVNSIASFKAIEKINFETQSVQRCEKENEVFWQFLSELDKQQSLEDAIAARDSLYDHLCEL